MKLFIGSKFTGHDSAVYIINPTNHDIFAMSTERITRFKHDYLYPSKVIEKYLQINQINPSEVSEVYLGLPFLSNETTKISSSFNKKEILLRKVFNLKYVKDVQTFKKTSKSYHYLLALFSIDGLKLLKNLIFVNKSNVVKEAKKTLKTIFPTSKVIIKTFDHAFCHAVSSYYSSAFEKATLITMDGYGDNVFSKAYTVDNGVFKEIAKSPYQAIEFDKFNIGSIGEIYSHFTYFLGFQPLADEGKVEALAAYGNHYNELYLKLMSLVTLDEEKHVLHLDIKQGYDLLKFDNLQHYLDTLSKEDIAAAVQQFLEDTTIPYYKNVLTSTGIDNLCLSGGIVANVIMNLNIFENVTKNLHIIPAMGDEGTSEGAAILMMKQYGYSEDDLHWLKNPSVPYLGPSYTNDEIERVILRTSGITYKKLDDSWPITVAKLLAEYKIGALFQGKMEWGPRALGNRSIIALADNKDIRTKINKEIKKRPLFQPFCPSILADEKDRLFESAYDNKHMTCAFRLKKEYYDNLPSAIHIDGTSRVQFVSENDNPNYFRLLHEIKSLTGFGVLINTSFNKHGRTMVEEPQDAMDDFLDTDLDFMMIGDFLVMPQQI